MCSELRQRFQCSLTFSTVGLPQGPTITIDVVIRLYYTFAYLVALCQNHLFGSLMVPLGLSLWACRLRKKTGCMCQRVCLCVFMCLCVCGCMKEREREREREREEACEYVPENVFMRVYVRVCVCA